MAVTWVLRHAAVTSARDRRQPVRQVEQRGRITGRRVSTDELQAIDAILAD